MSYYDTREAVITAAGDRLIDGEGEDLIKHTWESLLARTLPFCVREDLIEHTWEQACESFQARILPSFCVLDLFFRIAVEHRRVCVLPVSFRLLEERDVEGVRAEERCCSIRLEDLRHCDDSHGSARSFEYAVFARFSRRLHHEVAEEEQLLPALPLRDADGIDGYWVEDFLHVYFEENLIRKSSFVRMIKF